ncbi:MULTISPECIES: hypothetical protein [Olivibacter]|uniref:Uncharacterized protein n=1 Tax=Olivibacter jilunii TaxID=985016 RepID=A0ABW6AZ16_9SPHI
MESLLEVLRQEIEAEKRFLKHLPVNSAAFTSLSKMIYEKTAIYNAAKQIDDSENRASEKSHSCLCFSKALEKVSKSIPEDYWISDVNIPMKVVRPGVLQIGTFKSSLSQKKMAITLKIKYCPFCGNSINNQN